VAVQTEIVKLRTIRMGGACAGTDNGK